MSHFFITFGTHSKLYPTFSLLLAPTASHIPLFFTFGTHSKSYPTFYYFWHPQQVISHFSLLLASTASHIPLFITFGTHSKPYPTFHYFWHPQQAISHFSLLLAPTASHIPLFITFGTYALTIHSSNVTQTGAQIQNWQLYFTTWQIILKHAWVTSAKIVISSNFAYSNRPIPLLVGAYKWIFF